jgi:hypothetical protein
MNDANIKKREQKTIEKDSQMLGRKIVSKKVLGRVQSKDYVRPSTVVEPFKMSSENHKLFGLTKASSPRISESKKVKSVLSSEDRILQEIQNKGTFKARPFKKRLFS